MTSNDRLIGFSRLGFFHLSNRYLHTIPAFEAHPEKIIQIHSLVIMKFSKIPTYILLVLR